MDLSTFFYKGGKKKNHHWTAQPCWLLKIHSQRNPVRQNCAELIRTKTTSYHDWKSIWSFSHTITLNSSFTFISQQHPEKQKKKSNQSNCNSFHFHHILPSSICCQHFKWSQCTRQPLIRRCLCSSCSPARSLARSLAVHSACSGTFPAR